VASQKPTATVLYGSMYQDQWYVAREAPQFMKDAKAIIYGLMLKELEALVCRLKKYWKKPKLPNTGLQQVL
jgi:iron complex transport system substrate-binding protein